MTAHGVDPCLFQQMSDCLDADCPGSPLLGETVTETGYDIRQAHNKRKDSLKSWTELYANKSRKLYPSISARPYK